METDPTKSDPIPNEVHNEQEGILTGLGLELKNTQNERKRPNSKSPIDNKSTSLYKSVLKDSFGKPDGRNHSKVRFSVDESMKKTPRGQKETKEFDFHCSFDSDEENSPDSLFSCTQPVKEEPILQGVVAYIEARSNAENRFEGICKQMELLGAVVVKKFIPEVTHVVFKDGKKSTREKALKKGSHLVNVLWVESCRQSGKRVPEELFPVIVPEEAHTPITGKRTKRTKSMQPRPFEDDVRNSAERGNRKRKRKIAAQATPTAILSPLTLRLLSEDSQVPASPLVGSPMPRKHVPETPVTSDPSSPDQQDIDSKEAVQDLPNKRLDFGKKSVRSKDSTGVTLPSVHVKTPGSPKNIPTDVLQTASGPGKKRKRIQSKESTSNEPCEKPKQTKKKKSPNKANDEDELSGVKRSVLKKDDKENKFQNSNDQDEPSDDGFFCRLSENLVSNPVLSDSGVSLSEVETQGERTKAIKKNKRKYKKTEKTVNEAMSTEEEDESQDAEESKDEDKSTEKRERKEEKTNKSKRGKKSVLKNKKETTAVAKCNQEETETDDEDNARELKKSKNKTEKNVSRGKKAVRKKISDDTEENDDDDDISYHHFDDGDDENGNKENVTEEDVTEDDNDIDESDNINDGQFNEDNVSLKPKEKQKVKEKNVIRKKPSRSLVLTSMHFSDQDIIISVVRKLGGFYIADTVDPNTTHVVSGSPRRTLNVLMAIAQGNWLVSPEWVMKSLETGYWVDEEPYELSDDFPSAQLSRLERVSTGPGYRQELFANIDPIFVFDNTSPPRDALIKLITVCGGKVCTSVRNAGVCVGSTSRKTKAISVSERWIIDSITEHTALSFDSYVFNPAKPTSPTF